MRKPNPRIAALVGSALAGICPDRDLPCYFEKAQDICYIIQTPSSAIPPPQCYFEKAQDIYYKKQTPSYAISTYARFFEDTMIA